MPLAVRRALPKAAPGCANWRNVNDVSNVNGVSNVIDVTVLRARVHVHCAHAHVHCARAVPVLYMHCRFKLPGLCCPWIKLFCAELDGKVVPGISTAPAGWKQFRVTAEERSYGCRFRM